MLKKPASTLLLSLLVISALALAFSIQPIKASGTIYIRADGSIDPPTAPIHTADNITYMLTGDITNANDGIVVERDNIVLNGAGYTVQGTGSGIGIGLAGRTNTTVQDTTIKTFNNAIQLGSSTNICISRNTITANSIDGVVLGSSSNIRIEGNTINASSQNGIALEYSSNVSIAGNNITANSVHGTLLYYSSNISIAGNNMTNNMYGIYLYSSSNNSIVGDSMADNDYGIYLSSSNNNSIGENSITANNDDGIYLSSSNNNSIGENSITANLFYGIYLSSSNNNSMTGNDIVANNWYGIGIDYSSDNRIAENSITSNNHYGICLTYSSETVVVGDDITHNGYGIYLYSSSNSIIVGNNIINNGGGLQLGSFSSRIYHNNFVNNAVQATILTTASNTWDNGYPSGGNYWSDYTDADLHSGPYQNKTGSDGIGDTSYVIDANNRDNYPFMNPWVPYENGTIYIRANGSVDPSGAPILRQGDLYTLTSNISSNSDGIVIERDNILVDGAGQTLQNTQASAKGIELTNRSNVTINNMKITTFQYGIWLVSSSGSSLSGNDITNNYVGIYLGSSSNNSVSGNNITANNGDGIEFNYSSSYNIVSENNVTNNNCGIYLEHSSSSNRIYHNNLNNTSQVYSSDATNVWDNGYPSGGNYWSDYTGADFYSGPYQNETGSDGISDTPYVIYANNQDNYPLMNPYQARDITLASLTSAPTIICQGYGCLITVKVTNQGDTVNTTVTIYANITDTGKVTVILTFENVILNSHDSTTLTFMWNTSGFDPGNYTISAYATTVPGEINVADNTFVGNTVQIIQTAGGGGGKMPYVD